MNVCKHCGSEWCSCDVSSHEYEREVQSSSDLRSENNELKSAVAYLLYHANIKNISDELIEKFRTISKR